MQRLQDFDSRVFTVIICRYASVIHGCLAVLRVLKGPDLASEERCASIEMIA